MQKKTNSNSELYIKIKIPKMDKNKMIDKKINFFLFSKKGMSLFFLMELLILACIIIIFAGFTYRVTTAESKMLTFDSENLGLFLERIPSIEGNFRYVFVFNQSVNVDFTKDTFKMDKSAINDNKKYGLRYSNPARFQVEGKFKNVSVLYFYKIGNQVFVEKNVSDKLEKQLTNREVEEIKWEGKTIEFYSFGTNSEEIKSVASFVFEKSQAKLKLGNEISENIGYGEDVVVWINFEEESISAKAGENKKFRIYYNSDATNIAYNWQNAISNFIASENEMRRGEVEIYPLAEYTDIQKEMEKKSKEYTPEIKQRLDKIPIIITKTNAFGEYAIALRG